MNFKKLEIRLPGVSDTYVEMGCLVSPTVDDIFLDDLEEFYKKYVNDTVAILPTEK